MSTRSGPIYENRVFVVPESVGDYEAWVEEPISRAIELPGVVAVYQFAIGADEDGRLGRACQFVLEDDEALEEFVDGLATDIEADAIERFGDDIVWQERILREDSSQELPAGEMPECLNCGAHMRGQYCGQCGQRGSSRLISLWELVRDAFGDLFELDSRLWQTLVPLLIKPGLLTHDYLQGRRARYMPPFRMYLVLSLLFFLVAFFKPSETFGIFYDPQTLAEAESEKQRQADEEMDEVLEELAADGIIVGGAQVPEEARDEVAEELEDGFNIRIDDDGSTETECEVDEFNIDGPEWLKRRLTPERIVHVCEQIKKDNGRQFAANLVDNIPVALIVLLPLMAFVLKALYPLSRRYYVEHLLFFVHFHSFFFLILVLQILLSRLTALLPIPEAIGMLVIIAAAFYVPVYLFISMRRVYGQGRFPYVSEVHRPDCLVPGGLHADDAECVGHGGFGDLIHPTRVRRPRNTYHWSQIPRREMTMRICRFGLAPAVLAASSLVAACGNGANDEPAPTTAGSDHEAVSRSMSRTVSPAGAEVFFITPLDGDTVGNPVVVEFGIAGMAVVKAGEQKPESGHHHPDY